MDNTNGTSIFDSAHWYDASINWDARLGRELPFLMEVFGPRGDLGVLDAGCGPGRHLVALGQKGYAVAGVDLSADMLRIARERLETAHIGAELIEAAFDSIPESAGPYDGVFCLGNSLAASGSAGGVAKSIERLAGVLRPGGRMVIQLLNFAKLRGESPRVRGPRVTRVDGVEYVSCRTYAFYNEQVEVTNVTLHKQGGWKQFAKSGMLYAIEREELARLLANAKVNMDAIYGNYAKEAYDERASDDLIVVGTCSSSTS